MTFVKVLVCVGLILTMVPIAYAGHGCPGNIDSLHPRMLGNSLIVLPARVNQAGPYDFLVDTGAQVSTIDTSLAAALHLKAEGIAGVNKLWPRDRCLVLRTIRYQPVDPRGPRRQPRPNVRAEPILNVRAGGRRVAADDQADISSARDLPRI